MDNDHKLDNIPALVEMLNNLTQVNAELIGSALSGLHAEVLKDHGCAFASNLVLQVSANVFTSTLAYIVSHSHRDGRNAADEKVLVEIHAKLTEFIGDMMKQYGTRDGATILSLEIGKKPKAEPS